MYWNFKCLQLMLIFFSISEMILFQPTNFLQEIRQVFKAYNIDIDFRHLYLIADYMSFQGVLMPFNRYGINSSTSIIQKASFETAMNFMKNAALTG